MPSQGPDRRESATDGDDVVGTVDRSAAQPVYVIADVSTDDVWIASPTADAVSLEAAR